MIKQWYNTNAATAAEMVDVTDEWILEVSNGQVTCRDLNKESEDDDPVSDALLDKEVFGDSGEKALETGNFEDDMTMGHIALPIPVINVQYLYGKKPMISKLTGLSNKEIEQFLGYTSFVVKSSDVDELKTDQIISYKEREKSLKDYTGRFESVSGADAVLYFLRKSGSDKIGNMVLHHIPVLPLCVRFVVVEDEYGTKLVERDTNKLYRRILNRINRLGKLKLLQAPDIIIFNESRMLQEAVDALISNGLRIPFISYADDAYPFESLSEVYECITDVEKHHYPAPETHIEVKQFKSLLDTCFDYNESIPDGSYASDDPIMVKLEELEKNATDHLIPFINSYVERFFPRYASFSEKIAAGVLNNVAANLLTEYEDYRNDEDAFEGLVHSLEKGLVKRIHLFVKKRVKWL